MSNLTEFAEGQECTFRIPNVCVHDTARTSPCHLRYANTAGMGQRPNDLVLAHGCDACHNWIDGRAGTIHRSPDSWEAIALSALIRTLERVDAAFQLRKRT